MNRIETSIATTVAVVVVGVAAVRAVKTTRAERAKRLEIDRNCELDLAAIRNAAEVCHQRMANGPYYSNLPQLMADFDNEIQFQKIAIREK